MSGKTEDKAQAAHRQYVKMTETPVAQLVTMLGIPTIISMLVTSIYNMADTYFVSSIGTSASGAIGIVFGLQAILQAFGFMFGQGSGSIISRRLGARDTEGAVRFASTAFFASFAMGLAVAVPGLIFIRPFMYLLGSTDTILPYAIEYAVYILIAAPFMTSSCVLNNILRFEGMSAFAMIGLTAGGILNMFGDPLLMFVFHMGVSGAGMSTCLSQIVSFFILLSMFLRKKTQSRIRLSSVTHDISELWLIVNTGVPSLIRQGLNSVSTMILNNQAAVYGDAGVAAMSIVNRVTFFIFSVGLGMGQGFQPVAAFNYGAGKYDRVKKAFKFTVIIGEMMLGVLAISCFIFTPEIIRFFRDDDAVVDFGSFALRSQCIAIFCQPVAVCSNMLFQSLGKSGRAAFLSALRSGLYFIPVIIFLPMFIGRAGIQLAQPIADVLAFITAVPFTVAYLRRLGHENNVNC